LTEYEIVGPALGESRSEDHCFDRAASAAVGTGAMPTNSHGLTSSGRSLLEIDSTSDFRGRGTRAMNAPGPYLWSDHAASANFTAMPVAAIRRKGPPSKPGRLIASTSKLRSINCVGGKFLRFANQRPEGLQTI
jgi:hypothetical protein